MALATVEQIATVLNLTTRMVNRHVKEDGMPRIGRGEYDLVKCVHWYIDYLKGQIDEARRGGDTGRLADVRTKVAEAEMAEIKLARMRAEVITMEDVLKEVEDVFRAIKSHFLFLPRAASRDLSTLSDAKEIEKYLKDRVTEYLTEAASLPDRIIRTAALQKVDEDGDEPLEPAASPDRLAVGGPVPNALTGGIRSARKVANKALPKGDHGRGQRGAG